MPDRGSGIPPHVQWSAKASALATALLEAGEIASELGLLIASDIARLCGRSRPLQGRGAVVNGLPGIPQGESWSESLTAAATGAVQGQTGESGEPRRTEPRPSWTGGEQRPGGYVTRSDQGYRISLLVPPSVRGLSQPVEIRGGASADCISSSAPPSNKVIGVVCSGDVAVHRDQVKSALERGKVQRPDAVWVCFESKSDRMTRDLMLSLDMDPVVLPLNEEWRRVGRPKNVLRNVMTSEEPPRVAFQVWELACPGYDNRRYWRDQELLQCCDEVIVFHKRTGNSPWRERAASGLYAGKLFVVELGAEKPPKRNTKTSKPVGARA